MTSFLRRARPGAAIAVTLGCLVAAGPAAAAGEPSGLTPGQPSPTQSSTLSFTWGAPAEPATEPPALGLTPTGKYIGGLVPDGQPAPGGAVASGQEFGGLADGVYDFHVAALYDDLDPLTPPAPVPGPYAPVLEGVVDTSGPLVTVGLVGPRPQNGWYRFLSIVPTCSDPSPPVSGCEAFDWDLDGAYPGGAGVTATDSLGNEGSGRSDGFNYDDTDPDPGQPSNPGRLVADEPAFEWTRGEDPSSGVDRYELQYKKATAPASAWKTIAKVNHDPDSVRDYVARRDPDLMEDPLPTRELLKWRVRTFDLAGNSALSGESELTIDPTVPPAPAITGGPTAPTRVSSPTFSWQGAFQHFRWDVTVTGSVTAIRSGGGVQTQATVRDLPDGAYTFRVSQVTDAGRPSAEATRSFRVDTTPPAAPAIVVRPTFPAIAAPVFTWQTEPGAYSRWMVLGEGGVPVIGATDTPTNSAALPLLPDGAYSFQVLQVDAAGNASATSAEPFTMLAPLAPAPSPSAGAGAAAAALPRQNARRLKPKAGRTLPTRTPVLQWRRGPRGTKLYNLQIFRVKARRGRATPRITKVLSRFPKGRQYRAPRKSLRAGTCYVWRVWPYTGRAFTRRPVGVSNFCVASAKVLKKKQAAKRAKQLAAARRAAERRRR